MTKILVLGEVLALKQHSSFMVFTAMHAASLIICLPGESNAIRRS